LADGGTRFWEPIREYTSGVIKAWSDGVGDPSNSYWQAFDAHQRDKPATVFWFQMCAHPETSDQENHDDAVTIIDEIHRRVPDATVFVSAVNGYVAPHACSLLGADGPSRLRATADELAREGHATRGPDLPDLVSTAQTPSAGATNAADEVEPDGCHPNEAGEKKLGQTLRDFAPFS
jgi:hypothetical protein